MRQTVPVIYQDNDVVVVNKPAGITVIPERFDTEKKSVQHVLEDTYGKLFVVHRIDRDTTGVLCFARNEAAHRSLSMQFENRATKKEYAVIVRGHLAGNSGSIDTPIMENPRHAGTMIVHPKGKEALTLFEVTEQFRHAALLQVEIKTGRTHQIRVHFASAGHPLLVDPIYGKPAFFLSEIKHHYKATQEEERPTLARLSLHAAALTFQHPTSLQICKYEAPIPKDLELVLKLLRKYDQ